MNFETVPGLTLAAPVAWPIWRVLDCMGIHAVPVASWQLRRVHCSQILGPISVSGEKRIQFALLTPSDSAGQGAADHSEASCASVTET